MSNLHEEIRKYLNDIREWPVEKLAAYDVKEDYLNEIIDSAQARMKMAGLDFPADKRRLSDFEKICCYRISDNDAVNVDCDVALRSVLVYLLLYDHKGRALLERQTGRATELKFHIVDPGRSYAIAGDTINSFSTTTREYFRKYYDNRDIYVDGTKYLREEYSIAGKENAWEACFLSRSDDFQKAAPEAFALFTKLYHTIGNMIPVPEGAFNGPRGISPRIRDYWDLTLTGIYNWYQEINGLDTCGAYRLLDVVRSEAAVKICEQWLSDFKCNGMPSWNAFVENNYLQDFVHESHGHFGAPRELWKGHIFDARMGRKPQSRQEFEQFFTNAADWISGRGRRIAAALKIKLETFTDEDFFDMFSVPQ